MTFQKKKKKKTFSDNVLSLHKHSMSNSRRILNISTAPHACIIERHSTLRNQEFLLKLTITQRRPLWIRHR